MSVYLTEKEISLKLRGMCPQLTAVRRLVVSLLAWSLLGTPGKGQQPAPQFLQRDDLSGTSGGNLVVSINADPRTFNRLLAFDINSAMIPDRLSADLLHINRVTHELEPSLASSWETKDGRVYTLHLRRGLRFSDGAPLTIDDVLFSFQVIRDPNIQSVFSDVLNVDGAFPTISKVDEHTLRISFTRTVGVGLRGLDSLSILPKHRLQRAYQAGTFSSAWGPSASPEEIVGMGPFRLKEYQPGVRVILERNPYYWKKDKSGKTLPYLDSITFLIIPDRNVEALKFKGGEIDAIGGALDPENFSGLRHSQGPGRYRVQDLGPGLDLDFLWFNLNPGSSKAGKPHLDPEKRAIFEKSQFRQAVSHALDREGMARSIFLGLGAPHYGPVGPGNNIWNNPQLPKTGYDPARARQMLAAIGLKDSNGDGILDLGQSRPLEILLLTSRGNMRRERMTQIVKDNLSKVGLLVTTQSVDTRELIQRIVSSFEYEAMLFGFTTTDVTPDIQADLWLSSGSNHFWYPNQPKPATAWEREIDALTAEMVRTQDPAARKKLFFRIQEIWNREMPAVPTISQNVLAGWKTRVGNLRPSILRPHLIWNAEELMVGDR